MVKKRQLTDPGSGILSAVELTHLAFMSLSLLRLSLLAEAISGTADDNVAGSQCSQEPDLTLKTIASCHR